MSDQRLVHGPVDSSARSLDSRVQNLTRAAERETTPWKAGLIDLTEMTFPSDGGILTENPVSQQK